VKLDSDVYNPVYEEKVEFRETNIPPTATLLLKVRGVLTFDLTICCVTLGKSLILKLKGILIIECQKNNKKE